MSCNNPCGKIISGAKGIAQNMMGINQASVDVMMQRRDKCRQCEFATRNTKRLERSTKGLTTLSRCTKCNCFIAAKTKLVTERCPIGLW